MGLSKLSDADLAALSAGDLSKVSDEALSHLAAAKPNEGAATDIPNAIATGFNQGMLRLAGLPMDTARNVVDLGKAALGAPYTAVTGKAAPDWLQVGDRADVPLSGANLIRNAEKTKTGAGMVHTQNPDYEGGYLQAAGGAMAGAVTPMQAAMGVASGVAGKAAYDSTGNPAYAIAAGMLPQGAAYAAPQLTKNMIRGGEQGRQEMVNRLQALREAGVNNPTLGLASGNGALGGLETLLQSIPGSMGIFARARDEALSGMNATASRAAQSASPNRGARAAGQAVQDDLASFYDRTVRLGYQRLNDGAEGVIGTNTPAQVSNAVATSGRLSTPNPWAPATSGSLVQPRMAQWNQSLRADQGGSPAYTDGAGMHHPAVPPTGIPYGVVKNLRTSIGEEARSANVVGTPEQAQIKALYGALSDDMRGAALQSDMARGPQPAVTRPSSAVGSLARANDFYRSGMDRVKRTEPFANKVAPEDTFTALNNTAKENVSSLQAVKKSVTPETRGTVAGTIIDRLGRATAGNQNDAGDVFSPNTFLTNWNKMTPKARQELFSGFPNAPAVMAEVEAVAKAASMMKDNSRHWANPSGTAANVHAREMMRGLGVGIPAAALGFSSWAIPGGVLGTMGASRVASKAMTNPNVVRWASEKTPQISAEDTGALTRYLVGSGLLNEQGN